MAVDPTQRGIYTNQALQSWGELTLLTQNAPVNTIGGFNFDHLCISCKFGDISLQSNIFKAYFFDPCDTENKFSSNHNNFFGSGIREITYYQNSGYGKKQIIQRSIDEFMNREVPFGVTNECNFASCTIKIDTLPDPTHSNHGAFHGDPAGT